MLHINFFKIIMYIYIYIFFSAKKNIVKKVRFSKKMIFGDFSRFFLMIGLD